MIAGIKLWIAGAGIAFASVVAIWFGGKRSAEKRAEFDRLEDYVKTREKMDEVVTSDDPAVLRDWLRERGKR